MAFKLPPRPKSRRSEVYDRPGWKMYLIFAQLQQLKGPSAGWFLFINLLDGGDIGVQNTIKLPPLTFTPSPPQFLFFNISTF